MKRSVTVAAAAAAIAVVGLSGCSSDKKSETKHASSSSAASSSSSSSESSASVSVGGAAAATKVTIDGQDQNVTGTTVCTTMAGDVNIAIGGAATGIAAVLTDANPPEVKSVGLGNVNGVTLAYTAGTGQGDAKATKDGNEYKISGTATGIDTANPMQPVNKPFEIDVTCS
ncbi:lipoprotein LpqH [[Mycobacterium] holstebronense]|uniref:Lipoprotein LpqH n=1 Tax=[Mycobacterium] holstebronense TaxID=3064288 RepID=A0ABM9LN50_9MYCO|nr:lipoprotein LpqH [Mycolicibacter sp. MU0102]CAJ1501904.1 lipoprotein LpqH [Mycolicibacter sp. MU0102]